MRKFLIGMLFFGATLLPLHADFTFPRNILLVDQVYNSNTCVYDFLFYDVVKGRFFGLESCETAPSVNFYDWVYQQKILRFKEALEFFPYMLEHRSIYHHKNI